LEQVSETIWQLWKWINERAGEKAQKKAKSVGRGAGEVEIIRKLGFGV
jgi:hypothetical protein